MPVSTDVIIEKVRLAHLSDLAAMKINAIVRSGERIKDFIDLDFLSSQFSFNQIQEFYTKKYPNANAIMMIKAFTFFDDINFNEPINVIDNKYNWIAIQERLNAMILEPNKTFEPIIF